MKLVDYKYLVAFGLTFLLAACQSTPDSIDSDLDVTTEEVVDEMEEDASDAFGAGDRGVIDESENLNSADAQLLSTRVFYFDFDEAQIRSESYESLKAHARYLIDNSSAKLRLEGHADERGTREYNVALGERRGKAVAKFLRLSGVSGAQMEVISYGEEKPLSMSHDERSWAQNRRVELVYTANSPR